MSTGARSSVQDRIRDLDARVVAGDRGATTSGDDRKALPEQLDEAMLLVEEASRRGLAEGDAAIGEACRQALSQLDEARHRLASPGSDPAHAVVHDDLVRADLRRSLSLVRTALGSTVSGARSADAEALHIAVSLRRRYARLRLTLRQGTGDGSMQATLRAALAAITEMREDPAFAHVRVADRLQLANIQQRVTDWVQGPGDPEDGARLARLLVLLSNELLHINQRTSLRGHDTAALQRAGIHLSATDEPVPPPEALEALNALEGRDERIDVFLGRLRDGIHATTDDARNVLASAASTLGVGLPGQR